MEPVNPQATMAEARKNLIDRYCSHPAASPTECSNQIINAHTIQKRGGLAAIAEEGHVISGLAGTKDLFKNKGQIIPKRVGINSASTFTGFCGRHDAEMFLPVERRLTKLDIEACFLLSFRALAYEAYQKRLSLKWIDVYRQADRGRDFAAQCDIQGYIWHHAEGVRLGVNDSERWKKEYDQAFVSGDYKGFRCYTIKLSEIIPIVACGGLHVEYDFEGRALQKLGRDLLNYEHMLYNLTVLNGKSVAVFGWSGKIDGPATALVQSLAELPSSEKVQAIVRLAFEHLENVYMRPSWWIGLAPSVQAKIVARMASGIGPDPASERRLDCLRPDGVLYVPEMKVDHIITNVPGMRSSQKIS